MGVKSKALLYSRVVIFVILIGVIFSAVIMLCSDTYAVLEDGKIFFIDQEKVYEYKLKDFSIIKLVGDRLYCYDPNYLRYQLVKLEQKLYQPPVNARLITNNNGEPEVLPEVEGRSLDIDSLLLQLANGNICMERLELPFKKITPAITRDKLATCIPKDLWAQYTTVFTNYTDRTENVRLAGKMLDGLIIAPGEEFSFNNAVGPRETERGFRPAKIIEGGNFVLGVGGGVCQVSSTLYNTVLLAGLTIKERHNHSISITYVPLGRDATVAYPWKDLKFINNSPSYLLLHSNIEGNRLTISIYGSGEPPYDQIEMKNKIIKNYPFRETYKTDNSITTRTIIRKGQKGYLVETYRILKKGGEENKEFVSKDFYAPVNAIIAKPANTDNKQS